MNTVIRIAGALAIAAAVVPSLGAQWPSYPTAGVPRTPDGKFNATAPAPRTPDGKPDLSGIWNYAGVLGFRGGPPPPPPGYTRASDVLEHRSGIQGGTAVPALGR
jgi:hypothetical protein